MIIGGAVTTLANPKIAITGNAIFGILTHANTTSDKTYTFPNVTGTVALTSDIAAGTLGASAATAGATNTTVALNFSAAWNANSTSNVTINPVVGPGITALTTIMTGATTGFLKKTAADTYTLDTSTYLTSVAATNFASQTANTFLCAPNGSAGVPTFRVIATADIATALTTPGPIGGTTASTGIFTGLTVNGNVSLGGDGGVTTPQRVLTVFGGANTDLAPVIQWYRAGQIVFQSAVATSGKLKFGAWASNTDALITAATGMTLDSTGAVLATSFNGITGLASVAPVMDGTQTLGTSTLAARQDHVHGSDTSKQAAYTNLTSIGGLANSAGVLNNNGTGTFSYVTLPTVNAGTFAVSIGTAGATNTSLTWGTSTGFNANTASNLTYDLKIGPAISALVALMTGAGTGFIKKNGADTFATLDTSTYLTSVTPSNFASQTANTVLAAPNGSAGVPTFRALVAADIPALSYQATGTYVTSIGVTTANGVSGSSSGGTTPSLTITLGAITPSSVAATGVVSGSDFRNGTSWLTGNMLSEYGTNGTAEIAINWTGYNNGTTQFRNTTIYDGKQGSIVSFTGSTKVANFAVTPTVGGTAVLLSNGSAASLTSFPTFNQNTTGTAANLSGGLLFNNMGQGHSTQTDFNAVTDFGFRYIQGITNGPGTGSGQFYGMTLGLGSDYSIANYALQVAIPRGDPADNYISLRRREATAWGSWSKISAGYADTAGTATNATNVYQSQDPGTGTYRLLLGNGGNANSAVYNKSGLYWNDTGSIIQGANISGNAGTATQLMVGATATTFAWNNASDAPTYVWATNAQGSTFLAARANLSVQYATSETLATVTARGATTTGSITINGDLTVGNTTSSNIFMTDTDNTTRRIHCNSNYIGFLNSANGWGAYCDNAGNWYANNLSGTNTGDVTETLGTVTGRGASTATACVFTTGIGVAGNGSSNDPYGSMSVTNPSGSNYSYYGLTRAGIIGMGMGINTSSAFWIGDTTSGHTGLLNGTPWLTLTAADLIVPAGNVTVGIGKWVYGYNANAVQQELIRARGSGYAQTTYPGIQVGKTGDHIALFIDPVSIAGGSFNGGTNELFVPNAMTMLQANSGGTDWIGCMGWSNGVVSFTNKITGNIDTAALAAETTAAFGRTDVAAYPVCWIANNTNKSQMYSCAAVTIGSSTGTLNATTVNSANFCGAGGSTIYSTSSGVGYGAALQVREAGLSGAMASAAAYAPRLAFHWSGVVASSFSMGSDGHFYLNDNPGTGREALHAKYYYADHSYGSGMIGLYDYTKYRMIYGMAGSYISNLDGTTTANHYGIGYAFEGYFGVPAGLGHCATFANAGTVQSAVGSGIWTSGNIAANGNLTAGNATANALLILNALYASSVELHKGGLKRWRLTKETTDETGSNVGSNFNICAHNDDGTILDYPIQITRAAAGTAAFNREITCTGNITAYYSDERLKENIKPIENAMTKLKSIRGVTFTSNTFAETVGYKDKKQQVGVIAQEVQKVLPEVVSIAPFDNDGIGNSKSGENYLTVKYEKLTPLLIEAIKEQQTLIEKLEARLALLEAK